MSAVDDLRPDLGVIRSRFEEIYDAADATVDVAFAVDLLGEVKALAASVDLIEETLKAVVRKGAVDGVAEGELFRATVGDDGVCESPDDELKAKIRELVARHLSRQYVAAHTRRSPKAGSVRVVARTRNG